MRRGATKERQRPHVVDVARRPLAGDAPVRPREEAGVPLDVGRAERAAEELVEVVQLLEGWRGDVGMVGDQVEPPGRTGLGRRRPRNRAAPSVGQALGAAARPARPAAATVGATRRAPGTPGGELDEGSARARRLRPARAPAVAAWPHPSGITVVGAGSTRLPSTLQRTSGTRPVGSITIWSMRSFGSSKRKVRVRVSPWASSTCDPRSAAGPVAAEHEQGVVAVGATSLGHARDVQREDPS